MSIIPQSPSTDFTSTTLNGTITDTVTTISVNDASTIVTPCYAVIDREDSNGVATPTTREVIYISSKSSNDLSVTRGVDNSTKRAHNDSAILEPLITVGFWDDFYDAYDADHNPADGTHDITKVAMLSGATVQTLTNKILSNATLSSPNFSGTLNSMILSSPTIALGNLSSVWISSATILNSTLGKPVINGTNPTATTYTPGIGFATVDLDCSLNNFHVVTGHASGSTIAFTVTGVTNSQPFFVSLLQGTNPSTVAAWFATIRWTGGVIPTPTPTAAKRDSFGFIRTGADTYDGFVIGQNC